MTGVGVVVTDAANREIVKLIVPLNAPVASLEQAIAELTGSAEGLALRCERTGATLHPDATITEIGLLWGDTVIATGLSTDAVYERLLHALAAWQPDQVEVIDAMYTRLCTLAVQEGRTQQAFDMVQDDSSTTFLDEFPQLKKHQATRLADLSRNYAASGQYTQAQDAAMLAYIFEPSPDIHILALLAGEYIELQAETDPTQQLTKARRIYNRDPQYGTIAHDLRRLESLHQER